MGEVVGQLLIAGLTSGSIYGIIALAFTMIYNSTQIVNFAQGDFLAVGAMFAYFLVTRLMLPQIVAFLLILVVLALVGLAMNWFIVNPLEKQGAEIFNIIIATLAYGIILSQGDAVIFGKQQYAVPPAFGGDPLRFGPFSIWPQNLSVIVATAILVIVLWVLLNRTMLGLTIKAVGYNPQLAMLTGIRMSTTVGLTFVLSAAVSAVAGFLIAPIMGASPYMGLPFAVKGFVAAILGGMGNPFAGVIGGLILGLLETFSAFFISSSYSESIAFVVLLLMLFVRPTGLFPEKGV